MFGRLPRLLQAAPLADCDPGVAAVAPVGAVGVLDEPVAAAPPYILVSIYCLSIEHSCGYTHDAEAVRDRRLAPVLRVEHAPPRPAYAKRHSTTMGYSAASTKSEDSETTS